MRGRARHRAGGLERDVVPPGRIADAIVGVQVEVARVRAADGQARGMLDVDDRVERNVRGAGGARRAHQAASVAVDVRRAVHARLQRVGDAHVDRLRRHLRAVADRRRHIRRDVVGRVRARACQQTNRHGDDFGACRRYVLGRHVEGARRVDRRVGPDRCRGVRRNGRLRNHRVTGNGATAAGVGFCGVVVILPGPDRDAARGYARAVPDRRSRVAFGRRGGKRRATRYQASGGRRGHRVLARASRCNHARRAGHSQDRPGRDGRRHMAVVQRLRIGCDRSNDAAGRADRGCTRPGRRAARCIHRRRQRQAADRDSPADVGIDDRNQRSRWLKYRPPQRRRR